LFARVDSNSDFKQHKRYRLIGNGEFELVPPGGEIKHFSLQEQDYTSQLDTYGSMIALTRQMIINDDLSAFAQLPRIIGRQSAIRLEKSVYELLLSNPSSFFSTGNGNFDDGADSVLNLAGLTAADAMFMAQTDPNGDPVMIVPQVLLVPTPLKTTAKQLVSSIELNQTPASNAAAPSGNPFSGSFTPAATPWLDAGVLTGGSDTAWYLLAGPSDVSIMEVAFLNGQQNPTIESGDTDFNTLGMQWRAYHDFGVAMLDHRAGVKFAGV
jgi:hypothetical protein